MKALQVAFVPFVMLVNTGVVCAGPAKAWPDPPPVVAAIRPPDGPLQLMAGGTEAVTFIDLSRLPTESTTPDVWLFEVLRTGMKFSPGVVTQIVEHHRIDCSHETSTRLVSVGFDDDGKRIIWTAEAVTDDATPTSMMRFAVQVFCKGHTLPKQNVVPNAAAAVAAAKTCLDPATHASCLFGK